jgi:hypothetical protein
MGVLSTTFLELYGERLNRELGSEDVTELFTTARRKAAVNEAALEFVNKTECFQKQVEVALTDEQREYDLEAVISANDFLWVYHQGVEYRHTDADGNVTYRADQEFPRKDIPALNREYSNWRNASATQLPASWSLRRDGGQVYLGLSEPPEIGASESAAVLIPYVAKPTEQTDDSEVPFTVSADALEVMEPWLQGIVHYAAALLEPLRKNYAGEQRQRNLFAGVVADYLQRQRPKGGQSILVARNYYADARGRSRRVLDPRIY